MDWFTWDGMVNFTWLSLTFSFNKADFPRFNLCLSCNCIMDVRESKKKNILDPLRDPLGTGIVKRDPLRIRNR